ncbi:hypothetical protein [Candidatus Parabeggiatoa sp. HSG14]|uniref:hypothetical protein n=1 Tax=Candidatus Parabeggiatoa sp. HSG14 TaxID=3055593 RepID=UPI0025A7C515|nr:hypothetical protein [Thiotrichales bacterium HSG14]
MLQNSKIIKSRNDWRRKAVQRAEKIREYKKSQKRQQEKIAKLQERITTLEQRTEEKKL